MPRPSDQFPRPSHTHAARLEVVAQRARRHCWRNQKNLLASKGTGTSVGCATAQDGRRDRADAAMRRRAEVSPSHFSCFGRHDWTCVQPGRPERGRCCAGMGREVRQARRAQAVRLADIAGCGADAGEHATTHQPGYPAFSAFVAASIESREPEEVDKDSALPPSSGEAGRTSAWHVFRNPRNLALEATCHSGGPGRASCGNREGGS